MKKIMLAVVAVWSAATWARLTYEATPDQIVTFRLRSPEGGGHARFVWTTEKGRKEEILFTVPGDGAWRTRIGMFLGAAPDGVTDVGTYPSVGNLSAEAVGPSASPESGVSACADTGTLTVATPRSCALFAEGGACRAGALAVELGSEPAAVACIAVDGKPLVKSRRMLVTHLTDVQNTGVTYADERRNILLKPGDLPLLARAGEARITLALGRGAWEVWALSTTGARRMRVPVEATEEGLAFVADVSRDPVCATLAYEVRAKEP